MPQKTAYRPTPTNPTTTDEQAASPSKVIEHTDELLDEIDACIEENVLEVLHTYIQKGGE
jgi:ubiquitin-like protein Pup